MSHPTNATAPTRELAAVVAQLERDASREPGRAEALERLARIYAEAGHHELAMGAWQRRIDAGGTPEARFVAELELARATELALERWPEVVDRYLHAHLAWPRHPAPLVRLALAAAKRGEDPVALLFGRRACELDDGVAPVGVLTPEELEAFDALMDRLDLERAAR